jgi:NarL family two-component system sensor histidine kinase YdfH
MQDASPWQRVRAQIQADMRHGTQVRTNLRAFYLCTFAAVLVFYIAGLIMPSALSQNLGALALFSGLFVIHAGLHWVSLSLNGTSATSALLRAVYFIAQGALTLSIMLVSRLSVEASLMVALLGEAAGMLQNLRHVGLLVLLYTAISLGGVALIGDWDHGLSTLSTLVPWALFVTLAVRVFVNELEARQRAQGLLNELEQAHQKLAEYAEEVETLTLQNERQRMARELHDTLAQGLAGLVLQLEALEANLKQHNLDKAGAIATQAKSRARATLQEARNAITDLRAIPNDSSHLLRLIREEAEHQAATCGLHYDLHVPPGLSLPAQTSTHLWLFAREGLSNIARHAHATRVTITLVLAGEDVCMEIQDDGVGFAPDGSAPQGHYGLLGMRERARAAGGTFEVHSRPGAGTLLHLKLPSAPNAAPDERY